MINNKIRDSEIECDFANATKIALITQIVIKPVLVHAS